MSVSRRQFFAALAAASAAACRRPPTEPSPGATAQTIVLGDVYTNDPRRPRARGVAIVDGAVVFVGEREEALAVRGAGTRVLDYGESTVLPGLTDAHAHLLGLGQAGEIVDLRGAATVAACIERLRAGAPADGWILGRGWDQNLWGGDMPTATQLDAEFPDRPVWLRRIDGHAGWANTETLRRANITADTPSPEGGEVLRDASGAATGVLVDAAMDLVPVPEPTAEQVERWLRNATAEAATLGLTGVHEMGFGADAHTALSDLAREGALPIRVHGYASEDWFRAGLDGARPDVVEPRTRYGLVGVKVYVDGALGSRGAALIEPYSDRPEHRGALMHALEHFVEVCRDAFSSGLQVASHAIGDLGNRTILEAYALALDGLDRATVPRPRVEHVQIIDPADIPRFVELGAIASMQPTHATSDMPWAGERVGPERLAGAYAWRRFLDAGVPLAFGSDFPVERPSPLLGLYAAVTRQDLEGRPDGGWLPDQRVTMAEAIAAFTTGAAFAAHREDHLGRVAVGQRADLTVLDADPLTIDAAALPSVGVVATLVDGVAVFEA